MNQTYTRLVREAAAQLRTQDQLDLVLCVEADENGFDLATLQRDAEDHIADHP